MREPTLSQKIGRHAEALAALGRAVNALAAEIEAATASAHETLRSYQDRKAQASAALAEASKRYSSARRLFGGLGDIEARLSALKAEHQELSSSVIQTGDDGARQAMIGARQTYLAIAERIERLHSDAGESIEAKETPNPQ